jgi:hypothetical protein
LEEWYALFRGRAQASKEVAQPLGLGLLRWRFFEYGRLR